MFTFKHMTNRWNVGQVQLASTWEKTQLHFQVRKLNKPLGISAFINSWHGTQVIWIPPPRPHPRSHQFHRGGIWISKQAVFCTGAICWEWVTAAKFMVPLTLNTALTKLKQAGNRRVNNYPSNIPSWSDRTHTIGQFPSAASFPLPAGYEAFPQMLFLENN